MDFILFYPIGSNWYIFQAYQVYPEKFERKCEKQRSFFFFVNQNEFMNSLNKHLVCCLIFCFFTYQNMHQ